MDEAYIAHAADENGRIPYTAEEHEVWKILYDRQIKIVPAFACKDYLNGLEKLELTTDKIPQPIDVSRKLRALTNWEVEPVPALINFNTFFTLLSQRKFPAASFIRRKEHLEYLKEPDIFHEIFGHCPLLTNQSFANFTEEVGHFGMTLNKEDQIMLGRLYWFTVEFGLMREHNKLCIYGAGILSSKTESSYALEDTTPIRRDFNLTEILRMPYRYDQLQKIYYIINSFDELFNLVNGKILGAFNEAKALGPLPELA